VTRDWQSCLVGVRHFRCPVSVRRTAHSGDSLFSRPLSRAACERRRFVRVDGIRALLAFASPNPSATAPCRTYFPRRPCIWRISASSRVNAGEPERGIASGVGRAHRMRASATDGTRARRRLHGDPRIASARTHEREKTKRPRPIASWRRFYHPKCAFLIMSPKTSSPSRRYSSRNDSDEAGRRRNRTDDPDRRASPTANGALGASRNGPRRTLAANASHAAPHAGAPPHDRGSLRGPRLSLVFASAATRPQAAVIARIFSSPRRARASAFDGLLEENRDSSAGNPRGANIAKA